MGLLRKSRYKSRKGRKHILSLRKSLVLEHIHKIMERALEEAAKGNIELAEKMGEFARKLARWTGVKMPRRWRYFFCRKCKSFIMPGITARIRVRQNRYPHVVIYCEKCKNYKRIPIRKNKKTSRG